MENFILTLIIFILVISILVFVHELGHYFAAKKVGIKVEEFAIGMGPRIWGFRRGETEYNLRVLPIGGFVKMLGEGDYDLVSPDSYGGKKPSQRLLVLVAGVFMNFLLAILLLYLQGWHQDFKYRNIEGFFQEEFKPWFGEKSENKFIIQDINESSPLSGKVDRFDILTKIDGKEYTPEGLSEILISKSGQNVELTFLKYDSSAEKTVSIYVSPIDKDLVGKDNSPLAVIAGFAENSPLKDKVKATDVVKAINGEKYNIKDFRNIIESYKGKTVNLTITDLSGENVREIQVELQNIDRPLGVIFIPNNSPDALLGVSAGQISLIEFNGNSKLFAGIGQALNTVQNFSFSISQLFKKYYESGSAVPLVDNVGGAIGIFEILGSIIVLFGFWGVIELMALFSINLAVLNILPIPALDGGHVVFTLIEMITRKKLHTKFYNYLTLAGFIFLMSFMVFVTAMDLVKYTFVRSWLCEDGRYVSFVCDLSDMRR